MIVDIAFAVVPSILGFGAAGLIGSSAIRTAKDVMNSISLLQLIDRVEKFRLPGHLDNPRLAEAVEEIHLPFLPLREGEDSRTKAKVKTREVAVAAEVVEALLQFLPIGR
jgi:hypothetical protein